MCHPVTRCTLAQNTRASVSTPPSRVILFHAFFVLLLYHLVICFNIARYGNCGSISYPTPTHTIYITLTFLSPPRQTTYRQTNNFFFLLLLIEFRVAMTTIYDLEHVANQHPPRNYTLHAPPTQLSVII